MLPNSTLSVVLLLLLVLPGIFFELISERRRAAPVETSLREFGRIVLYSMLFTFIGLLLVAIVKAIAPSSLPDGETLLGGGRKYFASNYRQLLFGIGLQQVGALGSAWVTNSVLKRRPGAANIKPASAWVHVFRGSVPPGEIPYARVVMQNGDVYVGAVKHSSVEIAQSDRELVLAPPLRYKRNGEDDKRLPAKYQRVVLRGTEISAIAVAYGKELVAVEAKPRRGLRERLKALRAGGDWVSGILDR
ncbi:DUF6338 family protein [Kribbella solani]|uniref:Uncharacterized protein n=1 Tax=Kribbella solani TaxID=236067 RepID=A0A841DSW6_9ACTN|nr:DUF6338 family protein [Kribbella solani]MBB5979820.1 hypothetical protein [Kribbella solani]